MATTFDDWNPRSAVKRGRALLDEKRPGWRERIDEKTLNMAEGEHCILGQLEGSYEKGKGELGLSIMDAIHYGFACPAHELFTNRGAWIYLTRLWERELKLVGRPNSGE